MKELSMHILDIAQNSVRAKSKHIDIVINENINYNKFEFIIKDDGPGIPDEIFVSIKNPFITSRTTRKVGLGIPLLNDTCTQCNGSLTLETIRENGTTIHATMEYDHIDRPPLGDIASTIAGLITSNEDINFHYIHKVNTNTFELNTTQIKEVLGDLPLTDLSIYQWLKEYLMEGLDDIQK